MSVLAKKKKSAVDGASLCGRKWPTGILPLSGMGMRTLLTGRRRGGLSVRIFLTRYPSLLGVFVNNLDLGRKFVRYERRLYLIDMRGVTDFQALPASESHALFSQKHCFRWVTRMLSGGGSM